MECKNSDDSIDDCVASCAADGGVGGCAWKTGFKQQQKMSHKKFSHFLFQFFVFFRSSRIDCENKLKILTTNNEHNQNSGYASNQIEHEFQITSDQFKIIMIVNNQRWQNKAQSYAKLNERE